MTVSNYPNDVLGTHGLNSSNNTQLPDLAIVGLVFLAVSTASNYMSQKGR